MMPETAGRQPGIYFCQCGFATDDGEWFDSHQRQHDIGRLHDVRAYSVEELERLRRGLVTSLALVRPNSPACISILSQISAIDARLVQVGALAGWGHETPDLHRAPAGR